MSTKIDPEKKAEFVFSVKLQLCKCSLEMHKMHPAMSIAGHLEVGSLDNQDSTTYMRCLEGDSQATSEEMLCRYSSKENFQTQLYYLI